jgi:hypothetical protein
VHEALRPQMDRSVGPGARVRFGAFILRLDVRSVRVQHHRAISSKALSEQALNGRGLMGDLGNWQDVAFLGAALLVMVAICGLEGWSR